MSPEPHFESIERWLLTYREPLEPPAFLDALVRLLQQQGLRVWRASTSFPTRHPEVFLHTLVWSPDEHSRLFGVSRATASRPDSEHFTPIPVIERSGRALRCHLDGREPILYGSLKELADKGATDYFIFPLFLPRQAAGQQSDSQTASGLSADASYFSVTTDAPAGFSDSQLAELLKLQTALELRVALLTERAATRALLNVYLGPNAARRVLRGAVTRGDGELIHAAIWYCDLRGFTSRSDSHPVRELVPVLDSYFESVAGAVNDHGGEVLKFIGDAMLAIFPVTDAPEEPCGQALAAACDALAAVSALQADPPLEVGVALHLGEVMYGNIGGRERLDFTVIGAAVNEVCRVEPLCKPTGHPLLVTSTFARHVPKAGLVSLGKFELRGVSEPQEIFTLG